MGKPKKHKRKGPKDSRSGCLLCKPHKSNGQKHLRPHSEVKKAERENDYDK